MADDTRTEVVGVLGCGLMGSGIAQVCAQAGYRTIVREVDQATVDAGLGRIERFLDNGVTRGKLTTEARDATMGRLSGTTIIRLVIVTAATPRGTTTNNTQKVVGVVLL